MPTTTGKQSVEIMEADDPDFSFLASQAAVELDNLSLGRQTRVENVRRLGRILEASVKSTSSVGTRGAFGSTGTLGVFGRAIEASASGHPRLTMSELIDEAWKMAEQLSASSGSEDKNHLKQLRTFCVALSRASASFRLAVTGEQYEHPLGS
jgi:hypothetical protein